MQAGKGPWRDRAERSGDARRVARADGSKADGGREITSMKDSRFDDAKYAAADAATGMPHAVDMGARLACYTALVKTRDASQSYEKRPAWGRGVLNGAERGAGEPAPHHRNQ
ncbi:hypothetical protein [Burkholderia catarinensis]|uniref:hypothetical protein n=1 Tax=Burkholderia catarinensis TaxID=1108140 RepID=UPI00091C56A0|nr:hypothetical protein [Burkholderia catarinensis]KAG8152419.1 hypothetical protein BFF94_016960 [Burkholderia catarinensis]